MKGARLKKLEAKPWAEEKRGTSEKEQRQASTGKRIRVAQEECSIEGQGCRLPVTVQSEFYYWM